MPRGPCRATLEPPWQAITVKVRKHIDTNLSIANPNIYANTNNSNDRETNNSNDCTCNKKTELIIIKRPDSLAHAPKP